MIEVRIVDEEKEVIIYEACPGAPAELGTTLFQCLGEKAVCKECPRAQEGYLAIRSHRVPAGTKADVGSIRAGLKRLAGEPTCFHPGRATATTLEEQLGNILAWLY